MLFLFVKPENFILSIFQQVNLYLNMLCGAVHAQFAGSAAYATSGPHFLTSLVMDC